MNTDDKKLMSGHNYDGITELDNPLPGWWLTIFYLTIAFSIGYYFYYEMANGPSSDQELAQDLEIMNTQKSQAKSETPQASKEEVLALIENNEAMNSALIEYQAKCAACHGDKGQGIIGPNLTDNSWIHGSGDVEDIISTIKIGVLEKGMPPWDGVLKPEMINSLAALIYSLKGSNPPNPKAPEGTEY